MISEKTSIVLPESLQGFSDSSRVWMFQPDRLPNAEEVSFLSKHLREFAASWVSHNRQLKADGCVLMQCFILVILDQEASYTASGCSIDSLVHTIRSLGSRAGIDYMDRQHFYFLIDGKIHRVHMNDAQKEYRNGIITDQSLVFDNLIKSRKELESGWLKALSESWHMRFV